MPNVNKVFLIGHLGRDPELRYSPNGKPICTFSLATSEGFGDNQKTMWHSVVCFDKIAENVAKFVTKGSAVFVEGRIQYRTYKDREDRVVNAVDIVAHSVQFLGGKQGERPAEKSAGKYNNPPAYQPPDGEDSIPF